MIKLCCPVGPALRLLEPQVVVRQGRRKVCVIGLTLHFGRAPGMITALL